MLPRAWDTLQYKINSSWTAFCDWIDVRFGRFHVPDAHWVQRSDIPSACDTLLQQAQVDDTSIRRVSLPEELGELLT
jgi:hypothetical protein